MKIEIDNERILFKFLLFSASIPRENNEIEYYFQDFSKSIGFPQHIIVVPKIYKVGFWGRIAMILNYYFGVNGKKVPNLIIDGKLLGGYPLTNPSVPLSARTFMIEGKSEIASFLNNLKDCGYDVGKPFQEFDDLINEPVNSRFIPGTKERRGDRLVLMAVVFIIFEIMFFAVFFLGSKSVLRDIPVFLFITGILAIFCLGFYFLIKEK